MGQEVCLLGSAAVPTRIGGTVPGLAGGHPSHHRVNVVLAATNSGATVHMVSARPTADPTAGDT